MNMFCQWTKYFQVTHQSHIIDTSKDKGKVIPITGLCDPEGG